MKKNKTISKLILWTGLIYSLIVTAIIILGAYYLRQGHSLKLLRIDLCTAFGDNYADRIVVLFVIFISLILTLYIALRVFKLIRFTWSMRIKDKLIISYGSHRSCVSLWVVILLLLTGVFAFGVIKSYSSDDIKIQRTITHALGEIDGEHYINSIDSLELNYANGRRTFEADMTLTQDGVLVCRHDWEQNLQEGIDADNIPTLEQFMSVPLLGKYEPTTFRQVAEFMISNPDMILVTDTKNYEEDVVRAQFDEIRQTLSDLDATYLMDRIYVQIYKKDMYSFMNSEDNYHYIFTLYETWPEKTVEQFIEYCRFCVDNDIDYITFNCKHVSSDVIEAAQRYDINLFVHTVNDIDDANEYISMGIYGIYTDNIAENELEVNN